MKETGISFQDIDLKNALNYFILLAKITKVKINKQDYIKLKNFAWQRKSRLK